MRVKNKYQGVEEGDLTPMIDMTFQLIAFFMVLVNFTKADQNERIKLPESELAKPPETALEYPITLHLTASDTPSGEEMVIIGGEMVAIQAIGPYLNREATTLKSQNMSLDDATIIIRAHRNAAAGKVQELIKACQEKQFITFALRAKEEVGH